MLDPSERLRNAIIEGNLSITKRLLFRFPELWLNIDYTNGWNNLHYSSYNGNYLICFHLISFINKFGDENPYLANIMQNHYDMLTFDKLSPIHLTIINHHLQTLHYLLTEFPGNFWLNHQGGELLQTPLHYCCRYGFVEGFKLLLEKGADYNVVDIHNNNLLHLSFEFGKFDCIKVLIEFLYTLDNGVKLIKSFETAKNLKGWLPIELSKNFKLTSLYKNFKSSLLSASNSSSSIINDDTINLTRHHHGIPLKINSNLPNFNANISPVHDTAVDQISLTSNSPNKILASPIMSVNEFKRAHSQSLPTTVDPAIIRPRAYTVMDSKPSPQPPSQLPPPSITSNNSVNSTPNGLPSTPLLKKTSSLKSLTISPSIRLNTETDHIDLESTSSSNTTTTNSSPIKSSFPILKTRSLKSLNESVVENESDSPSSIAAKIAFTNSSRSSRRSSDVSSSPKKHKNSINSISFSRVR